MRPSYMYAFCIVLCGLDGPCYCNIAACPGAGVRKIEKFFWGLISLLRLAETMLGRPQSCWGKKETEHKWSCTTPMSWPKKVIKKAFGHHRGCIVKHFPPYLMWKKNSRCVVFSGTIECRGKVSTKYRKNEFQHFSG